ncbi:DUF1850 domain-containing protein [Thermococcus gorgonarius]|uniref:DUF1850 domain-containing protein n=1 Tax=Thermococcus gorgonarius TaxID=71997 RepID=A0A2Z2M576_THEGO|nr:DUF1850 domain-containing protein [Thermococcus gorgonarius]ASJ00243.1 hypothetical protein A3K92_01485 [Thermococcus gorgonarius]
MRRRFLFLTALLVFLILSLTLPRKVLIINDGKLEKIYPLGSHLLVVEYVHSVERSRVIEILEVNKSGIYAVGMKWQDFGAGLPEDFQRWNGEWYEKKISIPLGKSLDFWFIPLNQANISVDGSLALAPRSDTLVKFEVKSCPLLLTTLRRC